MKNNEKIALIKKYYKNDPVFLDLTLINYESCDFYVTLNYIKKLKVYRLSWFNLAAIKDNNIEKYLSCMFVPEVTIQEIVEDFAKFNVNTNYNEEFLTEEDIVIFNANIKTKNDDEIHVSFKRFLPQPVAYLFGLFCFIFNSMPDDYRPFLYEILALLTNNAEKYEYKKDFDFDLFNDDINKLFEPQISKRGKKYYDENKINFLEKIDDRYFAIVEGTEKYLIIIYYDEEKKKTRVYCSCPCEFYCKHIYSVMMAIRNNEFNRFYKIVYRNPNKTLMERVIEFNYILCLGIVEQNFEIVNDYGGIELIPILDKNGNYNWQVLEDTEDEKLTKEIKYFLDNQ